MVLLMYYDRLDEKDLLFFIIYSLVKLSNHYTHIIENVSGQTRKVLDSCQSIVIVTQYTTDSLKAKRKVMPKHLDHHLVAGCSIGHTPFLSYFR